MICTLEEERQERDEEDQENGDNASFDPVEDRDEVVAPRALLSAEYVALRVHLADRQLLVERANVQYYRT